MAINDSYRYTRDDPFVQEAAFIAENLDYGDPRMAAQRLQQNLGRLQGDTDMQQEMVKLVNYFDQNGVGTDLQVRQRNQSGYVFADVVIVDSVNVNVYRQNSAQTIGSFCLGEDPNYRYQDPRYGYQDPRYDYRYQDPRYGYQDPRYDYRYQDPRYGYQDPRYDYRYQDPRYALQDPWYVLQNFLGMSQDFANRFDPTYRYQDPRYAYQDPRYGYDYRYQDPRYAYQDPRYAYQDPRYAYDSRYQDPRYQAPRYQDPRYAYQDPRHAYRDPRYSYDSRYQDPRYQDPRYAYQDPRYAYRDPRYSYDSRYQDPRYQDPRYAYQDPRYAYQDPRYQYDNRRYAHSGNSQSYNRYRAQSGSQAIDGRLGLTRNATDALYYAQQLAAQDGVRIQITSAGRSYADQVRLYNEKAGRSPVARPGTSNHERGIAIDVKNYAQAKPYLQAAGYVHGDGRGPIKNDPYHFKFVG